MGLFQSSPSIQRETYKSISYFVILYISILSLYTEGDMKAMAALIERLIFQSSPSIQRETAKNV